MDRLRMLLVGLAIAFALTSRAIAQPASLPPQAVQKIPVRKSPGGEGNVVPGRFVVILQPKADPAAVAREHGVQPKFIYTRVLNGFAGPMSDLARSGLLRDNRIVSIEPVRPVHATVTPNSWGIDRIDQRALPVDNSYSPSRTGSGVTAYVVDTGIRFDHEIFGGRASRGIDTVGDGQNGNDCNGHGTHVAGTIGGGYGYGVAPSVRLVAARVLDCDGSGTSSGVIAALDWIAKNGRHPGVVNMSLGGTADPATDTAVRNLVAAGFTVAVAAGNDGVDACTSSPARVSEAITVGATDETDTRTSWSNYGSCVDLFAPGDNIISSWATSSTALASASGTSMASPHVAGAAALVLSATPTASPATVWSSLRGSATNGIVKSSASANNDLLFVGTATTSSAPSTSGPVTITGTSGDDIVNASHTVSGQPLPTSGNDVIRGLAGNDRLDGAAGGDRMEGGTGNDIFTVDDAGDVVVENAGEGNDQVRSSINYALPANVERLVLTGTAKLTGRGNTLANTLFANAAGDRLFGAGGNDNLIGGAGPDTFFGDVGSDRLTGGGGADRFMFDQALGSTNVDTIVDFNPAEDRIYLSDQIFSATGPAGALASSAFVAGSAATTTAQRIIYYPATGYLYYDRDGSGPAAKVPFAKLPASLSLTSRSFVIY